MPEVDSSIFLLQKLEDLDVSDCTTLKILSSNTCSPALCVLDAMGCINLKEFSVPIASNDNLRLIFSEWDGNELPSSLLRTKKLKTFLFPISDCLVDLPENFCENISLGCPRNLEHDPFVTLDNLFSSPAFTSVKNFSISNIPIMSEIPESICFLTSLEYLLLFGMAIRSLPETIKYLPRLNLLEVYHCNMLQSIPALSKFIPFLFFSNCESLEEVLSSTGEPYEQPNRGLIVLINCQKLDPDSYHTVLKDAMDRIQIGARESSENEDGNYFIWNILPAMPGMENWFHYLSTQVCVTLDLPSNLLGFAYYLVLSKGHMDFGVCFGCKCSLDNNSGEKICITSFTKGISIMSLGAIDASIHLKSDHVVLWYDPRSCMKIMDAVEQTKAISDVNSISYNPKLTFTFFIDETLYEEVEIKECGLRWIYQETVSSTISESNNEIETASSSDCQSNEQEEIIPPTNFESDDLEETIPPRNKLKLDIVGTPPSNLELEETHYFRCSLEELLHHMNTIWFGSTEEESNS